MNQLVTERNSLYKDIHSMVLKTAELMCKNLQDEDVEDIVGKLKDDVVAKYCDDEEIFKTSFQFINSHEDTGEDIDKFYEGVKKQPRSRPEDNHLYKQFEERVHGILHPEDTELFETQSTINLIDPVTKNRMKDPVKNVICNHTYDKHSIAVLIKAQPSRAIRCPYQGCNNQVRFKLQDLVPDEITRKALRSEEDDSS